MVHIRFQGTEYELRPSKIICLVRSYAAHAEELGNAIPDRMRYFLKPPSSLLPSGGTVIIPEGLGSVHHEVELAVIIGKRGNHISQEDAMSHILAYTIALDITARDLQSEAKEKRMPWTEAKGYDTFCPVGPEAVPAGDYDWRDRKIWLKVNGQKRQEGSTSLMLYPIEEIISTVSDVMTLEPDDMILTGTPPGVGPLHPGDHVEAGIDGIGVLKVNIDRKSR